MNTEVAAGIARAKGAKRSGMRLGHWLSAEQAARLLELLKKQGRTSYPVEFYPPRLRRSLAITSLNGPGVK